MSEPKQTATKVTLEVTGGTPASPDEPAEAGSRSYWLKVVDVALSNPTARNIALVVIAALILVVVAAGHFAIQWVNTEKPQPHAGATSPAITIGVGDDEPSTRAPKVTVYIPKDFQGKGKKSEADEEEQKTTGTVKPTGRS